MKKGTRKILAAASPLNNAYLTNTKNQVSLKVGKVAVLKTICYPREANCFCAEVMLQLEKNKKQKRQ
ncbi:hypothetical protein I79_018523 [Cricetulus griseus]|uniref:Uncharacterized protein n=1 Tax=Cricetulus griseus TaxID=10029 RepID=G3I4Y2_CRIGR|nr:hypothetical protein I79_018523 [Cricetulus griseus]